MFYHNHHLASIAAHHHHHHHHQLNQNRKRAVASPLPQTRTLSVTPPATDASAFMTDASACASAGEQQQSASLRPRTIAKPIARRPVNAACNPTGVNGGLHNSALLALAAAALNPTPNGGDIGGGCSGSPATGNSAAVPASSAPGTYGFYGFLEVRFRANKNGELRVFGIVSRPSETIIVPNTISL